MLRALLKREIEVEPLDEPAPRRPTLKAVASPNQSPKPRTKSFPLYWLYPQPEPEPQSQAEALLHEIQTYASDAIGMYVPQSHLERFYSDLCKERGWEPKHWCVIGRELSKLTVKVIKKRGTKRFMVYEIPRHTTR